MAAHLETPAEGRRQEKYICPSCGEYARWFGEGEKEKLPAGGWAFREPWFCHGGCLGFNLYWAPEVEYFNIHMTAAKGRADAPTS